MCLMRGEGAGLRARVAPREEKLRISRMEILVVDVRTSIDHRSSSKVVDEAARIFRMGGGMKP